MIKIKKIFAILSVFILTSCNDVSKDANMLLPLLTTNHTYLEFVIREGDNEIYLPLKFDSKTNEEDIFDVYSIKDNKKINIKLNELNYISGDLYGLILTYDSFIDIDTIYIKLKNDKTYEIPIKIYYIEKNRLPNFNITSLSYLFSKFEEKEFGYEYRLEYYLYSERDITLKGISESLKDSIFKDSTITISGPYGKIYNVISPFEEVRLDKGSYDLTITIPENDYIYYFNNDISFKYCGSNSIDYTLFNEDYDNLDDLNELYLNINFTFV